MYGYPENESDRFSRPSKTRVIVSMSQIGLIRWSDSQYGSLQQANIAVPQIAWLGIWCFADRGSCPGSGTNATPWGQYAGTRVPDENSALGPDRPCRMSQPQSWYATSKNCSKLQYVDVSDNGSVNG